MSQVFDYLYRGNPNEFMARVSQFPNLDREEELELIARWQESGDKQAQDKLFASHQKLLVRMIYNARLGPRFEEALQAGNVGLMLAINKFEAERGFRLSTYASWWITAQFKEVYPRSMVNLVTTAERKKISNHLLKALNRVTGGREPLQRDFEKAAELMQVDVQDVLELYPVVTQGDMSLDAPLKPGEENSSSRLDFMPDYSPSPEEIVAQMDEVENARARLTNALEVLFEREREIFVARRLNDPPATLEELAEKFNISRERIRQIEIKAFERVYDAVHGIEPPKGRGNHRIRRPSVAREPETLDI